MDIDNGTEEDHSMDGGDGGDGDGDRKMAAVAATATTAEEAGSRHEHSLLGLPLELKRRTATFLTPADAINLSQTCISLHNNLAITSLHPPRVTFSRFSWEGRMQQQHHRENIQGRRHVPNDRGDDLIRRCVRLPVWNRRVHSITLSFSWRDQGWGIRTGQVYIVGTATSPRPATGNKGDNSGKAGNDAPAAASSSSAASASAPTSSSSSFHDFDSIAEQQGLSAFQPGVHRVVCTSPLAPHSVERISMTFVPVEGEVYHLWYKVGEGGGHSLHLRDGVLRTVIFDDEDRNLAQNFQILHQVGALTVASASAPGRNSSRLVLDAGGNANGFGLGGGFDDGFGGGGGGNGNMLNFIIDMANTVAEATMDAAERTAAAAGGGTNGRRNGAADNNNDDPARSSSSSSNFYPRMLLRVSKMLRRQLAAASSTPDAGPPDEELSSFMEEFGIPVTEASLLAVEEIVQSDLQERALELREQQQRLNAGRRGDAGGNHNNNNNNRGMGRNNRNAEDRPRRQDGANNNNNNNNNNINNNNNNNGININFNGNGNVFGMALRADVVQDQVVNVEHIGNFGGGWIRPPPRPDAEAPGNQQGQARQEAGGGNDVNGEGGAGQEEDEGGADGNMGHADREPERQQQQPQQQQQQPLPLLLPGRIHEMMMPFQMQNHHEIHQENIRRQMEHERLQINQRPNAQDLNQPPRGLMHFAEVAAANQQEGRGAAAGAGGGGDDAAARARELDLNIRRFFEDTLINNPLLQRVQLQPQQQQQQQQQQRAAPNNGGGVGGAAAGGGARGDNAMEEDEDDESVEEIPIVD